MSFLTLQSAFTSGELSVDLSARVDLAKYSQGCRILKNFKVQPQGGAVKRPGFLLLDELPGPAALISFIFNKDQAYCLAFGEHWMRVFTKDGPVLSAGGSVYQIATPYTLAQARELSVAQSADVLFIASWGVPPYQLKRRGHANWGFEVMTFTAPMEAPGQPTISFTNGAKNSDGSASAAQLITPYTYYVTALNADGKESELSPGAEIEGPPSNSWQAGDYVTLTWPAVAGAVEYRLYKTEFSGRPGYIALVGDTSYKDYNVAPSLSEGAPSYEEPFTAGDYPGVVGFFEQRLVFSSSPNRPQTIWMSKSGDYLNFAKYHPLTDDAPLELTIASPEVSSMCWLASQRSLIMGSTSMEWEIATGQDGAAFSAKTAKAKHQSRYGSTKLPALIVGNEVLHITRSGEQVRNLKYQFSDDAYGGTDNSIMATHLTERYPLVDWCYQQSPDSVVWAVREDGVLLGLTYQSEHNVLAWHRHETQGAFLAVLSVPQGRQDVLFAVTQRGDHYFLERQAERYIDGDYSRAVFMDCALVYDQPGAPVKSLHGLDHLEGLEVGLLSGGAVEAPRTVAGGTVTLDRESDLIIVGLPYVADLETMPVEIVNQGGASVGRKKQINAVSLKFRGTVGARVGTDFGRMETVKWRTNEPYGQAPKVFSGDKNVVLPTLAENVVTVCVRSDEPTPMTLLALMPQLKVI
jgi:hypothetical protein